MMTSSGITALMALSMGLRHGLDADHLAVVDALARPRALAARTSAAWTGVLFALGHVAVILILAVTFSLTARAFDPPPFLEVAGAVISSATLLVLGGLNVRAALSRAAGDRGSIVGLRSRLFASLRGSPSAGHVFCIGALFAVSFDAVAVAGLFAGTGGHPLGAMAAAAVFAFGMLAISAVNGIWVARLLGDVPMVRRGAARIMSVTIGLVSLAVGAWILMRVPGNPLSLSLDIPEIAMSLFVVGVLAIGYGAALVFARRANRGSASGIGATPGAIGG
jgi:high-affinity nickel-transport protein